MLTKLWLTLKKHNRNTRQVFDIFKCYIYGWKWQQTQTSLPMSHNLRDANQLLLMLTWCYAWETDPSSGLNAVVEKNNLNPLSSCLAGEDLGLNVRPTSGNITRSWEDVCVDCERSDLSVTGPRRCRRGFQIQLLFSFHSVAHMICSGIFLQLSICKLHHRCQTCTVTPEFHSLDMLHVFKCSSSYRLQIGDMLQNTALLFYHFRDLCFNWLSINV